MVFVTYYIGAREWFFLNTNRTLSTRVYLVDTWTNETATETEHVVVAEWLRRWTRNPLGSARAGSNPADYVLFTSFFVQLVHFEHL